MKKTIYSLTLLLAIQPVTGLGMLVPQNENPFLKREIRLKMDDRKTFPKFGVNEYHIQNKDGVNIASPARIVQWILIAPHESKIPQYHLNDAERSYLGHYINNLKNVEEANSRPQSRYINFFNKFSTVLGIIGITHGLLSGSLNYLQSTWRLGLIGLGIYNITKPNNSSKNQSQVLKNIDAFKQRNQL